VKWGLSPFSPLQCAMRSGIWLAVLPVLALPLFAATPDGATPSSPDYVRDIQPILEQHCYECHGAKKTKGSLRLDRAASARKGGMTGPAVVAGDSEHSLLVRRLLGLDGEDRMPLDKDPLPEAQVALIRRWIRARSCSGWFARRRGGGRYWRHRVLAHGRLLAV